MNEKDQTRAVPPEAVHDRIEAIAEIEDSVARAAAFEELKDQYPAFQSEIADIIDGGEAFDARERRRSVDIDDALGVGTPVFEQPPSAIGPYRLGRTIGKGGMGTVFEGVQDEPIQRRVAIKLIHAGKASGYWLKRFAYERIALTKLSHPNIARVIEAGATEDGATPFLVMDLVHGEPITRSCDAAGLSVAARLRLFLQVCNGVKHAHLRGIIHRDLKPQNILIESSDDGPVAKIIDFGLARDADFAQITHQGELLGTPAYMSPEQIASPSDVDVRADVYSLGVILYELLTGLLPIDTALLNQAADSKHLQSIRSTLEAAPPSAAAATAGAPERAAARATTPRQLRRILRGEADWIAARAIHRDREGRYETVEALAKDIANFLDDRPISIERPSRWYVCRKFAQRHRWLVATAALLVTVSAISLWLILDQGARARQNLREGIDIAEFMVHDLREDLIRAGRADLVGGVAERVERFFAGVAGEDNPVEAARIRTKAAQNLAEALASNKDRAAAKSAFERAIAMCRDLVTKTAGDRQARLNLADLHLQYGDVLNVLGANDRAIAEYESARALAADLVKDQPQNPDCRSALVSSLYGIGRMRALLAPKEADHSYLDHCIEVQTQVVGSDPGVGFRRRLAELHRARGLRRSMNGQPGVEADFKESLRLLESCLQHDPDNAKIHFHLARTVSQYAATLQEHAARPAAIRLLEENEERLVSLLARDPGNRDWSYLLARDLTRLGEALTKEGRIADGRRPLRDSIAILAKLHAKDPNHSDFTRMLSDSKAVLAGSLLRTNDVKGAKPLLESSLTLRQNVYARTQLVGDRRSVARSHDRLAKVEASLSHPDEMREHRKNSIEIMRDVVEHSGVFADRRDHLVFLGRRAIERWRTEKTREDTLAAIEIMRTVIHGREALHQERPDSELVREDVISGLDHLGEMSLEVADLQTAESVWQRALAITRQILASAPDSIQPRRSVAAMLAKVAKLRTRQDRIGASVEVFKELVRLREECVDRAPKHVGLREELSASVVTLARLHERKGDKEHTLAGWQRLLKVRQSILDLTPDNSTARARKGWAMCRVADALAALGRWEDAIASLRAAELIRVDELTRQPGSAMWQKGVVWIQETARALLAAHGTPAGRLEHAEEVLYSRRRLRERGVAWADQVATAHAAVGALALASSDPKRAVDEYSKALDLLRADSTPPKNAPALLADWQTSAEKAAIELAARKAAVERDQRP